MVGKLILLDFDGVLNSTYWSGRRPIRGLLPPEFALQACEEERLDPACVDRLQRLVHATNAHIVVTSSWRHKMPISEMVSMFALYGFSDVPIIGVTPDLRATLNHTRGLEVVEWLKANQPEPISYVCLDDDGDFNGLPLVQTNADIGLQDLDVNACREVLNKMPIQRIAEEAQIGQWPFTPRGRQTENLG